MTCILEDNIDIIKRNADTLVDASKDISLEANVEKTKHFLLSLDQNAVKNHDIKLANRSFENVSQF
jgi:uncharacterized protein (DUF1778 family)